MLGVRLSEADDEIDGVRVIVSATDGVAEKLADKDAVVDGEEEAVEVDVLATLSDTVALVVAPLGWTTLSLTPMVLLKLT